MKTMRKLKRMRTATTLLATLFTCLTSWAQYVFVIASPANAAEVRVGTDQDLGFYHDGSHFITDVEPGQTVYFDFNAYTGWHSTGITYDENLSADDVTLLDNELYSFVMPEGVDWLMIYVNFEKDPVVVTGLDINEDNFPDPKFRSWLLSQWWGTDAVITDAEMASITDISAPDCGIEDLTGIEHFTELAKLNVGNSESTSEENRNKLTTINLSALSKLRTLWCGLNQITSLDLSQCPDLRDLQCFDNALTQLDVSQNPDLRMLYCSGNQLTTLDITNNTGLAVVTCDDNQLTGLDVTHNPLLEQLYCENNLITAIDVTNHDKLMLFNCNNNQLSALDLTGCTELYQLYCYNNKISGQAMTDMVNSLETPPSGGYMVVIDLDSGIEQNDIMQAQADVARGKRWSVEAIEEGEYVKYPLTDEHDYVDLGLPSGTLWATCNVGAKTPKGIGLFFAWGDTQGHGSDPSDGYLFSWENYKWGYVSGEETSFTKYCTDSSCGKDGFTDGKYELDPQDDAAYVNWGSQWRMPTKAQLDELKDVCTWTPMTVQDVEGYEVEGPNGNTIFLPETGWRIDDMLLGGGAYWSRSSDPGDVGGAYYLGWDEFGEYSYGGRLDGQCIRPVVYKVVELADDADNGSVIEAADDSGNTYDVMLRDRTLYKDGSWNTLCLPFDVADFSGTPLEGATVKTLSSSAFDSTTGTLTLNFSDDLTAVEAGKPYIVKWAGGDNVTDPLFTGMTISNASPGDNAVATDVVTFQGIYSPMAIPGEDKTLLFMGADNMVYYPETAMDINACRAYFQLADSYICGEPVPASTNGINAFVLNFDGEATGISATNYTDETGEWYSIDGRRIATKPTTKGVYIFGGRKVVVK